MAARRAAKWQHAPAAAVAAASAPRILNLPRRPGRRAPRPAAGAGRHLGALFDLERRVRPAESAPPSPPPPPPQDEAGEQEKWRFQAEILRAECNFLRMEREVALRKLDRHRGQMEAALKSAVETLVSGRNKIDSRGESAVAAALEDEIEDLEEVMQELRAEKESGRGATGLRELQRCRGRNFDRQASALRRRLAKMPLDAEPCVKEIREIAPPAPHDSDQSPQLSDVERLRRKMEGMSSGMRERMAEYSRRLQAVAAAQSGGGHRRKASTGSQRSGGGSDASRTSAAAEKAARSRGSQGAAAERYQQPKIMVEECKAVESSRGCCDCRAVVGKIMEQVRAEAEQWSEMQEMLEQVRLEMQELQSSSDAWQRRAIASDMNVRSLTAQMLEWKHRARVSEQNADELEKKFSELQSKIRTLKAHLISQEQSETGKIEIPRIRTQQHRPLESGKEREKHVLICRVKNSPDVLPKRSPLQEIGNFR